MDGRTKGRPQQAQCSWRVAVCGKLAGRAEADIWKGSGWFRVTANIGAVCCSSMLGKTPKTEWVDGMSCGRRWLTGSALGPI